MTTIALYSDLHLELQYRPTEWLTTVPDILILAGDISYLDRVDLFLVELIDLYSELQIVFIAGNHEYYESQNMQKAEDKLKASLAAYDRIHFLQCDTLELFNIRFIGCTGWPRMLGLGKEKQQQVCNVVSQSINDFYQIGKGDRTFTTDDCIELGEQHYKWLEQTLSAQTPCEHTVVITHFAPSFTVANPKYPIDEMSAYFYSAFDDLIEKYQPDLWVFGHTHANFDLQVGPTRVISNQHGYGKECSGSYRVHGALTI